MNNTLTEAEKDRDKAKETETDIYSDKDISKSKEKGQENTAGEKGSVGEKYINSGHKNTTAVDREDKYTGTVTEKTVSEGRNEGVPDERNTGSEKATGGSKDKVGSKGPDNSVNTVEKKEPEEGKPPEKKQGSQDTNFETGKTDVTEIVPIKDKGQDEKERKEEQVNGKSDPDKVGPNDTKLRTVIGEGENAVETFKLEMTKNNTVIYDTKDTQRENNSIGSPEGNQIFPTGVNITQYTMYRAGGEEIGNPKEKLTIEEDKTEKDSAEKTKEELEREREEKEKEKEKEANLSFTGKRLNDKIKNKYYPLHLGLQLHLLSVPLLHAEKSCPPLPRLYHGYHQSVPGVEPETVEFFCNHSYAVSGDAQRTCQPDGTWSGKQPLCVRGTAICSVHVVLNMFNY